MRNKGAIWILAVALTLVCIYQLSFTWKAMRVKKHATEYAQQGIQQYADNQQNVDSIIDRRKQFYLDSISNENVYNFFGIKKYTYREVQEREINLGLDLQGGMNVVLEVSVEDVIRSLSNYSQDSAFNRAIALANQMQRTENKDFVTLFGNAFATVAPNARLAAVFNTVELKDRINYNSTNEEVLAVIREETESAVKNAFNIIRTRIDHFGVVQPNVQRIEGGDRILVELPGVDEKARVRKLLQGTARLEFWEAYDNTEVYQYLLNANDVIKQYLAANKTSVSEPEEVNEQSPSVSDDTLQQPSLLQQLQESENADSSADQLLSEYPFFEVLRPYATQESIIPGSTIGTAFARDTATVNTYMKVLMEKTYSREISVTCGRPFQLKIRIQKNNRHL
ncbi:MAG: hypothetical protein HC906_09855 [Bacteroidales bacterium]|nr:hypothetical protein [Bacteroidales bacterium]